MTRIDTRRTSPHLKDPFVTTPRDVVLEMLKLARVRPNEKVFDLGCGDGRIPIAAAQHFGACGVGVELRRSLANKARDKAAALGLSEKVTILQKNFRKVSLEEADVLALYLTRQTLNSLAKKFKAELRPGARIVAWVYPIEKWKPDNVVKFKSSELVGETTTYLYVT